MAASAPQQLTMESATQDLCNHITELELATTALCKPHVLRTRSCRWFRMVHSEPAVVMGSCNSLRNVARQMSASTTLQLACTTPARLIPPRISVPVLLPTATHPILQTVSQDGSPVLLVVIQRPSVPTRVSRLLLLLSIHLLLLSPQWQAAPLLPVEFSLSYQQHQRRHPLPYPQPPRPPSPKSQLPSQHCRLP